MASFSSAQAIQAALQKQSSVYILANNIAAKAVVGNYQKGVNEQIVKKFDREI
jgi:hypothetical protein